MTAAITRAILGSPCPHAFPRQGALRALCISSGVAAPRGLWCTWVDYTPTASWCPSLRLQDKPRRRPYDAPALDTAPDSYRSGERSLTRTAPSASGSVRRWQGSCVQTTPQRNGWRARPAARERDDHANEWTKTVLSSRKILNHTRRGGNAYPAGRQRAHTSKWDVAYSNKR